jgi:hypothetical protein
MFLHSGAAMHRHEFSAPLDPRRSNSIPRRSPLARSAFSPPIQRRATTYEIPTPVIDRLSRPLSDYIPKPNEHSVHQVRFQEPEADTMSEDGRSADNSDTSEVTTGGSRRRRRQRTSATFLLAHPAPTLTQKQRLLQIRPRLLLQLQRLSSDSRPRPAIDVLPSTVVVPRLAKKFPRMFRGKGELGANDVMVVKSEDYDKPDDLAGEDADPDEETLANRDLMAVICQMPKDAGGSQGKAEIVLSDGTVWVATPLPNGSFEFVTIDENHVTTKARWVKRSGPRNGGGLVGSTNTNQEFKYTFSIIDPNTRRHPIVASITQTTLDIPDYYTSVSSSAGQHPPTAPLRRFPEDTENHPSEEEIPSERTTYAVEEDLRTLTQVTGIWVALRRGLSPYFKYFDSMTTTTPTSCSRIVSHGRARSASLTPDGSRPSPAGTGSSTPESSHSALTAVGGKIRLSRTKGSPSTTQLPRFDQSQLVVPKRSVSAGTAFMQRAAARKIGNPPSTVPSDSEGEVFTKPPKRTATENLDGVYSNSFARPPPLNLPVSSTTNPNTPTKPHRRVQSAYVPSNPLDMAHSDEGLERRSLEIFDGKAATEKPKNSKWRTFTAKAVNIFRHLQRRPDDRA